MVVVLLAVGNGATAELAPPLSPSPVIRDAEHVGAIASLPTDAADGHTPTFAFTVAPEVDLRRSYSYAEFVALFGTKLQALDLDVVDVFTDKLDTDPRDSRLTGAEVAALAKLLEDTKREAQQAVRTCRNQPHSCAFIPKPLPLDEQLCGDDRRKRAHHSDWRILRSATHGG